MEPTLNMVQSWINNSKYKVKVIPRSNTSDKCEELLGIKEHSTLGTLINLIGGISVANGVIRHFGGNNDFGLSIKEVNLIENKKQNRIKDVLIVADDIYGGLFAINVNLTLCPAGKLVYLPPESYVWENLNIGHSAFVEWSMSKNVPMFYKKYEHIPVVTGIAFNNVINYIPPLWSKKLYDSCFNYEIIDSIKMIRIRSEILEHLSYE